MSTKEEDKRQISASEWLVNASGALLKLSEKPENVWDEQEKRKKTEDQKPDRIIVI